MKNFLVIGIIAVALTGCLPQDNSTRGQQATKAKQAADSIRFTENAEIENVKKRLTLTADPGKLGFIVLLNETGQPVMYEGVVGKVTSGGKRLTPPMKEWYTSGQGSNPLGPAPSDEGTWGSGGDYIFYWNTEGVYRQWSGKYLYSDQPIRLKVEPLVVSVETKQ